MANGFAGPGDIGNAFFRSFLIGQKIKQNKEEKKALAEAEKQADILVRSEMQKLTQQQAQGQQLLPQQQNLLQQAALIASNAQEQQPLRILGQASPAAPGSIAGEARAVRIQRAGEEQQERERFRGQLEVARLMGLKGKRAREHARILSSRDFPNEEARLLAYREALGDVGMTELQRLQAERTRQLMAATEQEMEKREFELRQLRREAEDLARIESIARSIGEDPRLFRREFATDIEIARSHNANPGIRRAETLDMLYEAEEAWAVSAAGELGTTPERVLATIRPLNEQYETAALSAYRGGMTPDELTAQLHSTGQLADQANARLSRRWYLVNGLPLDAQLTEEQTEAWTQFVKDGLRNEVQVLREAYRLAYRQGAVDTNLFRGVQGAEFPAARPTEPPPPPPPDPAQRRREAADVRVRAIQAAIDWLSNLQPAVSPRGFALPRIFGSSSPSEGG